ncbi:hypothetical protein H7I58_25685 [Mycolicibacterium moriokaense]|nr:hypothetical protein [Mycolicibacterium moriokaense]
MAGVATAPVAQADDWALNGRYLATSNGDWAQINEVYHDLPSVRSTWTIAMTCTTYITCSGRVDSDEGWSADIVITNSEYIVDVVRPNWEPCPDGTAIEGHQRFRFFPVAPSGFLQPGSRVFAGIDKTRGRSGGCGKNDTLQIEIPFRLEKLD